MNILLFSPCLVSPSSFGLKTPRFLGEDFFLVFTHFWTQIPVILQRRPSFLVFTYFWYEKGCHHEIPPRVRPFLATPLSSSKSFFIKEMRTTWDNKEVPQTFCHSYPNSRKYNLIRLTLCDWQTWFSQFFDTTKDWFCKISRRLLGYCLLL